MDRIQDVYALEEQIYELVDGYLQEADCYATAPVLAVWKRCGKLNVAVDVENNLKLTKTADVFPIADVLRPLGMAILIHQSRDPRDRMVR